MWPQTHEKRNDISVRKTEKNESHISHSQIWVCLRINHIWELQYCRGQYYKWLHFSLFLTQNHIISFRRLSYNTFMIRIWSWNTCRLCMHSLYSKKQQENPSNNFSIQQKTVIHTLIQVWINMSVNKIYFQVCLNNYFNYNAIYSLNLEVIMMSLRFVISLVGFVLH